MVLHLTPCSGLVYRDNSFGASFSTCNVCLPFNCHLFVCLSVCRSVERPGTPYHYDWYSDRPSVVHLWLSKGLLPSAPSTTPRGTREPQTETLAETTTSCLNESLAMSSKKKKTLWIWITIPDHNGVFNIDGTEMFVVLNVLIAWCTARILELCNRSHILTDLSSS